MHTFLLALALILPQDIATYPVVNEVFYDTPGTDSHEEWVEIYNPTGTSVNLSDFKIGDEEVYGGTEGMYEFPDGASIGAHSYIVVCMHDTAFIRMYGFSADYEVINTNATPDMVKYSAWGTGSFALGNSGDEVLLVDSLDNVVDVVVYEGGSYAGVTAHPGVSTGHSIERMPAGEDTDDCSVDMIDQDPETPGTGGASGAPVIESVWCGPFCPDASANDTIYAVITDDVGLQSETLWYSLNGGTYSDVSMSNVAGDTFYAVIPGQSDAAHIRYYVIAEDLDANTDTSDVDGYFAGLSPIDSLRPNDTDGIPLYVGHAIRVTGLVTVNSHTFETTTHIINMQNNGVGTVAKSSNSEMAEVHIGDSITVCGSISYWMGQTRILSPNSEPFVIDQLSKRDPDIYVLQYDDFYERDGDDNDYEGLLVGLIDADSYSGNWGPPNSSYGVWLQEFGASPPDTVQMWVDEDTDIDNSPEPSWPVDVVGVYSQYDNTEPYWSGYEIMPRSIEDFDYDLPVQLTGFSAAVDIGAVLLMWETACEQDVYLYEIRRAFFASVGCDNAEVIGEVEARGNAANPEVYGFSDTHVDPGETYYYWLAAISTNGQKTITGPVVATTGAATMSISRPYPNPFNTSITYLLASSSVALVNVSVYDLSGRHVKTLFSSNKFKGKRNISWDALDKNGKEVCEGVYFIRNQVGGQEATRKVLFVR